MSQAEVDPLVATEEALQYCAARNGERRVAWACDANGRTGNRQSEGAPPRVSEDTKSANARGQWLLLMAEQFGLVVLNGTSWEADSPGRYTSIQKAGSAVVDYMLVSVAALPLLNGHSFSIEDTPKDHRLLKVVLHVRYRAEMLTRRYDTSLFMRQSHQWGRWKPR
ncbi:hypothetical protein BDZ89DRAFT_199848 [Hymenopellis radicata]|nr:hypothetical protein BDZ89DRAFT_199848 [Hymenopellis radicata]